MYSIFWWEFDPPIPICMLLDTELSARPRLGSVCIALACGYGRARYGGEHLPWHAIMACFYGFPYASRCVWPIRIFGILQCGLVSLPSCLLVGVCKWGEIDTKNGAK